MNSEIVKHNIAEAEGLMLELLALVPEEERPYFEKVLDHMVKTVAPASASLSNHGGFDGGLLVHSARVTQIIRHAGVYLNVLGRPIASEGHPIIQEPEKFLDELNSLNPVSCFKVGLLHDCNKMLTLNGHPYYVPNMIKNGTERSKQKPWEINKENGPVKAISDELDQLYRATGVADLKGQSAGYLQLFSDDGISIRDGLISLAVAERISPGILKHISPLERRAIIFHDGAYAGRTGLANKENMLQLALHFADMIASRFFS